jgi:hypothetical protein
MKQISKILGISFVLCGLICLSSCDKDEGKTLATPSDLTVISAADNYALLAWSTNIYVESYEISVGSASGTSEGSYYNVTALTPNTNYTWKIRAKRGTEVTAWVDGPVFTTLEVISASAPGGLTASSVTNKSAVLSWTSNAPSFKIAIAGNTYTSSAASYVVENLTGATTYPWSVKAVNGPISGDWVAGPDLVTLEDVLPPTALTASPTTTGAVLSWTSNATSFDIEIDGHTYTTAANSYTITGLIHKTVYEWKVRAEKNAVISDWATGSFKTLRDGPPTWNEYLAETNIAWWFKTFSPSVTTLLNVCNTNVYNEYSEQITAIIIGDSPWTPPANPGRGVVLASTYGSSTYYAQFFYDFTPPWAGDNVAITYTNQYGVNGQYYDYLYKPFLDAITAKSPYTVTGDDINNPTEMTITSVADPDFWFTVY